MSVTISFSGSITPTLNRYHAVGTVPTNIVCQFFVNAGNMRGGDMMDMSIVDTMAHGTPGPVYAGSFANQQGIIIKASDPIALGAQGVFFIRQTAGTPRTYFFEVRKI